ISPLDTGVTSPVHTGVTSPVHTGVTSPVHTYSGKKHRGTDSGDSDKQRKHKGDRERDEPLSAPGGSFGFSKQGKKPANSHPDEAPVSNGPARRKSNRQHPAKGTPFPDDWQPDDLVLQDAAEIAGWDRETALRQFKKFRDHHRSRGSLRVDWPAAWRKWCADDV